MAWAIVAGRLPWLSHTARLRALEAEGRVLDDVWFAAHGQAAPE